MTIENLKYRDTKYMKQIFAILVGVTKLCPPNVENCVAWASSKFHDSFD